MRPSNSWAVLTALLLLASTSFAHAPSRSGAAPSRTSSATELATSTRAHEPSSTLAESGTRWIVDRADNICGLDDAKMLSKPAKVDYDALLKLTAEMKKMRDDKIDPSSPEGIRLRQAAVDRVRSAADKVRVAEGYCSVWKQIRHQDGRTIPDITDLVKAQL
jgi:hypothetical protein